MKKYILPGILFLFVVALLLIFLPSISSAKLKSDPFKVPQGLESKVNFWTKIYTEYTTDQVIIHDADNLDIIYEVIDFSGSKKISRRAKNREVKKVKNYYRKTLRKLARKKKNTSINERERKVLNQVKKSFWRASNNIRAQLGQRDRFKAGLKRSGYYIDEMRRIFREFGLPEELTALPHVESSFQIGAYSKSGASGIWQFIRSTGRRYMRINYAVDERRDPFKATIAAAKLLKVNYEELGNWPLAITAYNHGLNGMKRAKAKLRSDDIVDVVNDYKGRAFGFASGNFYAGFLAALEVSQNYNRYFPGLTFYKPMQYEEFKLPDFIKVRALSKKFHISKDQIAFYNPSLRLPVIKSEQYVPAGFSFKLPKNHIPNIRLAYSLIPDNDKFKAQKRTKWYRIKRGDNLSRIARRFRTNVNTLKSLNQLSRSGRIYAGQVLQLPGRSNIRAVSVRGKRSYKPRNMNMVFNGEYKKVVVKRNETLDSISRKHNVTINDILRNNRLRNRHMIYVGQKLKIPVMVDKTEKIKLAKLTKTSKKKPVSLEKASTNKIELTEANTVIVADNSKTTSNHLMPVSVKKDPKSDSLVGFIIVDVDETIGHYAEWSRVGVQTIRRLNGFRYGRYIHLNQKIKVPFSRVTADLFFQKRSEYHKSIEEDFFASYKIEKTVNYLVKSGVTVWEICNEIYGIPLWLLRSYNPATDLENLKKGQKLIIPVVS